MSRIQILFFVEKIERQEKIGKISFCSYRYDSIFNKKHKWYNFKIDFTIQKA